MTGTRNDTEKVAEKASKKAAEKDTTKARNRMHWWGSRSVLFIIWGLIFLVIIRFFPSKPADGEAIMHLTFKGLILDVEDETIFSTLTTILIAIDTLAVTAFIFLATALTERRKRHEQKTIRSMLKDRTIELLCLTGLSIICIFGCMVYGHAENCSRVIGRILATLSFLDLFCLLLYSRSIINYEKKMVDSARKKRKAIEKKYRCSDAPKGTVTIQTLGNISIVVERLLENHAREYHYIQRSQLLRELTDDDFVNNYKIIEEYRDCLRIENRQQNGGIGEYALQLGCKVQMLEKALKTNYLKGESMTDMTFSGEHFFDTIEKPFNLQNTVFSDSFLKNINLSCAKLQGADLSRTRLHEVNLIGANCTNAVFTQSVWNGVKLSANSCFKQAVFQDADFNQQIFSGTAERLLCLFSASFVHANLLRCKLTDVDLSYSNFRNALLSDSQFSRAKLSYVDFSGATMTKLILRNDNSEKRMDACYANLDQCTLASAYIQRVDWEGSRIANSNFTFSYVNDCIFDSCYGQNLTFRDAKLESCEFQYAMLRSADFTYAQIIKCDFSNGNLQECLFISRPVDEKNEKIRDCLFVGTNFSGSLFQGCVFYKCNFSDADFSNTKLLNVQFEECTFSPNPNFVDADCHNIKGIEGIFQGG